MGFLTKSVYLVLVTPLFCKMSTSGKGKIFGLLERMYFMGGAVVELLRCLII